MQSVQYTPYDLPYTPLVAQHLVVNSPHVNNQFARFQPQDYHQYADSENLEYLNANGGAPGYQIISNGINGAPVGVPGGQSYQDYDSYNQIPNHIAFNDNTGGISSGQLGPNGINGYNGYPNNINGGSAQSSGPNGAPIGVNGMGLSSSGNIDQGEFYMDGQFNDSNGNLQSQFSGESNNGAGANGDYQNPLGSNPATAALQGHPLAQNVDVAPSRTVYLGNVPSDITPKELLDHVRSGIIENVRLLSDKMCAFISFLDKSSALLFHSDAILKRLTIKDNDIKIGWGKNVPLSSVVLNSIQRDGATRNVYIGNLPKTITEEQLINDLNEYGQIDTIKILADKGVAFIHFCSILSAIKVVTNLSLKNEFYADKKIFYGKDRCAFITKTQQHNAAQYLGLAPGMEHLVTNADREFISSTLLQQSAAAAAIATTAGGANNLGNRTVYLGNLPKDIKIEEICNVVRGGLLQNVKYLQDRHVCFITFIDPIAAAQFFAMSQLHGLTIHNKRIKIGWGKHSGPLSNALTLAVSSGASRNIYIGNIDVNNPKFSKEQLRERFLEFGEIEQINYLLEKNCVFVNFTNISHAILAIDKIKIDEDFKNLKINFGKDRCGNIPRQFVNQK
ncbi:hypothetical protein BN7_2149 [Wickerhamomyces ciferrii]|uniref:RRM domain-containing protein n=1 Tax=Wickerhamomyces ciferrii (strain ATCC 14091 / BCRC 22168 / CBS 111 / JCM 3599 / NBRC 0793 / NRRL Y-1031 F-60-10) TaxID=1206466 RepID=K0KC09_WICCF|nr:uncharacterized protein BN7_2149 [Wickerhamomyces ciferrii]CCH42605.1 hypothetical protein BN7_2149 [Wickerhamomyces ciferrii]